MNAIQSEETAPGRSFFKSLKGRILVITLLVTLALGASTQIIVYQIFKEDLRKIGGSIASDGGAGVEDAARNEGGAAVEGGGVLAGFRALPTEYRHKLVTSIALSLLAIALCFLLIHRALLLLLQPLGKLTLVSKNVALGDFSQRVPVASGDELGQLSAQFNSMCDQLERNQSQLVQAEKLKAVGEMAAGIAHDFNNVLFAISARLELIRGELQDGRLRGKRLLDSIEVMLRAAQDGAETVRKIREFSRPHKDKALTTVNLNELASQALEMSRGKRKASTKRGIMIRIRELYEDIPPILANPVEVREALTNLIHNSVDAMPDGGTLILSTALDAEKVRVTVADTGEGMDEQTKGKVLDPFFTTKGTQGSGLGLSMVYGIMKRLGGDMRIESVRGQGTAVSLFFPVTSGLTLPETDSKPESPSIELPPRRVLVVDDEQYVGEGLVALLEDLGQEARFAHSGQEALQLLEANDFDYVFSDLGMPEISGWDLARAVKKSWPHMAVVLVTGWGDYIDEDELLRRSVMEIVPKPVSRATLQAVLQKIAVTRGETLNPV